MDFGAIFLFSLTLSRESGARRTGKDTPLCNLSISYSAKGPWNKSLNSIFPTTYVITKSLKVGHWLSQISGLIESWYCWGTILILPTNWYGTVTVDGSEIRRSPVDMVNIPLFTTGNSCIYRVVVSPDFFQPSTEVVVDITSIYSTGAGSVSSQLVRRLSKKNLRWQLEDQPFMKILGSLL